MLNCWSPFTCSPQPDTSRSHKTTNSAWYASLLPSCHCYSLTDPGIARWVGIGAQQSRVIFEPVTSQLQIRHFSTCPLVQLLIVDMNNDANIAHENSGTNSAVLLSAGSHHSSRIRFLRFFLKIQKTQLFTFFEVSCQKNVKNVLCFVQVFTFLHFKIANEHFHCKTVTHTSCYTYNIILKLFIFG